MNTIQNLTCPQCQQQFEFIPTNNRRKYCSIKCKRQANQVPEDAESRKRYLNSPKGKATNKRKMAKYYQSQTYNARIESPEYKQKAKDYAKQWAERHRKPRLCPICEDVIIQRRAKFCSNLCKEFYYKSKYPAKKNILRRCPGCREAKQFSGTYCSNDCYQQSDHGKFIIRQGRHLRRARMRNAYTELVDPLVIAKRDKYKCHICRKRVNMNLEHNDKYSPTMDHLIPISLGGDHSYANIQLAHRTCNSSKGNRAVNEQLLLFG